MNIQGKWKAEWTRRVAFFDREVGRVETKVKKKSWGAKLWAPFKKKKKVQETKLQKLFGEMDAQYKFANASDTPDNKRHAALEAFLKTTKTTAAAANKYAQNAFTEVTSAATKSDMNKQELAAKKNDITNLSCILQDDVDALITSAHTAYLKIKKTLDEDGKVQAQLAMQALKDVKLVKRQLQSNIKKISAWIGKAERNLSDVAAFNKSRHDLCRDVMAPLGRCNQLFREPADQKEIPVSYTHLTLPTTPYV